MSHLDRPKHPEAPNAWNPFRSMYVSDSIGYAASQDVKRRLADVQRFDLDDCYAALKLPDLQYTVRTAIRARMKRLRDTPQSIKGALEEMLDFETKPGLARGMVLNVYTAKIKEVCCTDAFAAELKGAVMRPSDPDAAGYGNPVLVIRFNPGSMWTTELHMRRYQLLKAINERLGIEFLKEVKVK